MSLDLTSDLLQINFKMPKGSKNGMYSFDRYKLDVEKLMLYRDEIEISLPPKIVKTLAVLIQNRGSILSKDELIDLVWSDSIVEESNLSQNLYVLRKTLGEKPDGGQYIETLRRRGYRFTSDVQIIEGTTGLSNGSEAKPSRAQIGVEREGNVLRLVDWTIPERFDKGTIAMPDAPPFRKSSLLAYIFAIVLFAAVASAATALYLYSRSENVSSAERHADLTVTRLTTGNYVRDATISRDGNYFVYNEELDGTSRVWLQQTGRSQRVEIIPGGKWPICCKTFSPDGKFIYFLVTDPREKRNDLYRVATLGGTIEKVLEDVNSHVSFSPDGGQMIFQRHSAEKKASSFIIAASDGKGDQREVLASNEQVKLVYAAWAPDGKKIAFTSATKDPRSEGVCSLSTLDLESQAISPISDERWGTCYRMEWLQDGSGIAMVGTREGETNSTRRDQVYFISYPAGRSRRLTNDGNRQEPQSLGVTNDGAILAVPYSRSSQIWSLDANGDSRTAVQLTTGTADGRGSIAPLPDGRVGYTGRAGDAINVWIMNADGSNQQQVGDAAAVQDLTVTPDGKYFVYANESGTDSVLYRMGTDGSDPVELSANEEFVIDSTVSPDGTRLVYDVWKTNGNSHDVELRNVPLNGGEPFSLAHDNCGVPHFSPDGAYISCVYFSRQKVAVLSAKDGSTVAGFDAVTSALLNSGAHWTPDGRALVYIVHQKNVSNLWKQPIDGGRPEPLTDFTNGSCYSLAYSWDGTRIYLARGDEIRDAVLITNYK